MYSPRRSAGRPVDFRAFASSSTADSRRRIDGNRSSAARAASRSRLAFRRSGRRASGAVVAGKHPSASSNARLDEANAMIAVRSRMVGVALEGRHMSVQGRSIRLVFPRLTFATCQASGWSSATTSFSSSFRSKVGPVCPPSTRRSVPQFVDMEARQVHVPRSAITQPSLRGGASSAAKGSSRVRLAAAFVRRLLPKTYRFSAFQASITPRAASASATAGFAPRPRLSRAALADTIGTAFGASPRRHVRARPARGFGRCAPPRRRVPRTTTFPMPGFAVASGPQPSWRRAVPRTPVAGKGAPLPL